MAHDTYEFQGKTVDDAIAQGLASLGLSSEQVEVEILHKGSRGIFGIGSEPALVRLSIPIVEVIEPPVDDSVQAASAEVPQPETSISAADAVAETIEIAEGAAESVLPDVDDTIVDGRAAEEKVLEDTISKDRVSEAVISEDKSTSMVESTVEDASRDTNERNADDSDDGEAELVQMSAALLDEMIDLMGFDAEVEAGWREADDVDGEPYLSLHVVGSGLNPLIGRRGEILDSIQYLLRLMVNQRVKRWKNIVVDIDNYKQRRIAQLTQLAQRMAQQVAESGRSMPLEPMSSMERRIIHLTLRDHPDVITESQGEGERRKVHILRRS